jgi:hypothetical protein
MKSLEQIGNGLCTVNQGLTSVISGSCTLVGGVASLSIETFTIVVKGTATVVNGTASAIECAKYGVQRASELTSEADVACKILVDSTCQLASTTTELVTDIYREVSNVSFDLTTAFNERFNRTTQYPCALGIECKS